MMTKITMPAGALLKVTPALEDLSANRLPIALSVKVGRMQRVAAEFHGAFMQCVLPIIAQHTGGGDSIGPEHEGHAAFMVEAGPHFEEPVELEVETIALASLEAVEGVAIQPNNLSVLRELGFITDTPAGE